MGREKRIVVCPRCGREMYSISVHIAVCRHVPLAEELYRFIFEGDGRDMSIAEIAKLYDCSPPFLTERLLAKYDCAKELKRRKRRLVLQNQEKGSKRRAKMLSCLCCTVFLEKPEPFGLCYDCQERVDAGTMPSEWLNVIEREKERREDCI